VIELCLDVLIFVWPDYTTECVDKNIESRNPSH